MLSLSLSLSLLQCLPVTSLVAENRRINLLKGGKLMAIALDSTLVSQLVIIGKHVQRQFHVDE